MSFIAHLAKHNDIDEREAQLWVNAAIALSNDALTAIDTWSKRQADLAADNAVLAKKRGAWMYHRGAHDALRSLTSSLTAFRDGIVASSQVYQEQLHQAQAMQEEQQ